MGDLPSRIRHHFSIDGDNVVLNGLPVDTPHDLAREAGYKIFYWEDPGQEQLGEVNVARGVNQVDEETILIFAILCLGDGLLDERQILLVHFEEHGDGCGLDGDATVLLILPGVGGPGLASFRSCDDTSLGDEGIGEGGLAVVDVRNHGHVPDVLLLVHAFPHLVCCEVNHDETGKVPSWFNKTVSTLSDPTGKAPC